MSLYSIKMRAARNSRHVSGAERIIKHEEISSAVSALTERALRHSLGRADFINLKIEEVPCSQLLHLDALPVKAEPADTTEASFKIMAERLRELDIANPEKIIAMLRTASPMRGAILYDIASGTRIEPDRKRGIRVTYMDASAGSLSAGKNHFREALVLATKVVNAPGIIAELCISDDPAYVTGYLASKKHGYLRLSPLKEAGSSRGGRIFLFDSTKARAADTINFLENKKVLVDGLTVEHPAAGDPLEQLKQELERLKKQHLYRSMKVMDSEQSRYVDINGRHVLMMASNSYLDLAADPRVKKAAADAALQWGAGSGGSRLTTGNTGLHARLEAKLAEFKHTEAALLFNTGYTANVGTISALTDSESVIFSDEYNHASIIDGCRLSKAKIVVYRHNDMKDLERRIQSTPCRKGLIISDAVFSMDGDIVNLPEFTELGRRYHMLTMIDEAHATGVIGAAGRGAVEYFGNTCSPDIIMGTLSKSLGAEGGFVCGSRILIEYLLNKARSFIFSTSQSPAVIGAALRALEILEEEPQRAAKLQHNAEYFCRCLQEEGIAASSPTAIIPIIIGSEEAAVKISEELLEQGCMIPAIRYPTVAKGTARLRAALMATHTEEELRHTAKIIAAAIKKYK